VLVIDNSIAGPAGGGTRMVPDLTVEEVGNLARAMTYKWAIFDLPTGGSKAGIYGDPNMPADRKRAVLRSFGRAIRPYLADNDNLFGVGPDMGMEGDDVEEIYAGAGAKNVVTWEASPDWVIDGDHAAYHLTGRGVASAAKAALEAIDRPITGATMALEGFGQVGSGTARYLVSEGARIVAITTVLGGVHDPDGIDITRLIELRRIHGDACVFEYGRGKRITTDQLISVPCDVVIPGARPNAIDAFNVASVHARIVCPAGNLSVTGDAEERLHRHGITCVPDFVVNGGGIIACWVDLAGGGPRQALDAVARMVGDVTRSVLVEARTAGRPPGICARARVREQLLAKQRRRITFAEATAQAKAVLRL